MSEPDNDEPKIRRHTTAWIAFILMVPVFYVLSIGPVAWMLTRGGGMLSFRGPFGLIYGPLLWIANESTWVGVLLDWYVRLFLR